MALKEMEVPESPRLYTTRYMSLSGVDYSCDITEVDKTRTPTGTNMISDEGANPVKRLGWRVIDNEIEKVLRIEALDGDDEYGKNSIPNLWVFLEGGIGRLHHASWQPQSTGYNWEHLISVPSMTTFAPFSYDDDMYIFCSNYGNGIVDEFYGFYRCSNKTYQVETTNLLTEAYIPTVTITVAPDGSGGFSLEPINLLQSKVIYTLRGTGTDTTFFLYPNTVGGDPRYQSIEYDSLTVELLTNNGWQTLQKGVDYTTGTLEQQDGYDILGSGHSVKNLTSPTIIFTTPPPETITHDNIRVTFKPFNRSHTLDDEIMDGFYKSNIKDLLSSKTTAVYGHTAPDRIFAVGGISKNKIYYSAVNDPTYFPDVNYLTVGYDDNEIMGMVKSGDSLAVIKNDSVYDNTLYIVRGSFLDENMVFTVVSTSAKLGAISKDGVRTLVNEPMYLSRKGIYGIMSNWYTTERDIRNRSRYLDKKMLAEKNLENACTVVWNKYFIVCVNDHCYILDGRKQSYDNTGNTNYQYEAFYWENIPATCFTTYKEELYFGTADGRICKFNTDVTGRTKYCDNGKEYWITTDEDELILTLIERPEDDPLGETVPIVCEWSTLLDDDGRPQYFKTLNKKGNLVTLLPQEQSSCWVELNKDGEKLISLDKFYADIFDWALVDFERFPFSSSITARDDYFRKKVKKYKRLQIIIRNDALFEPFGILGITKTYTVGNFAK